MDGIRVLSDAQVIWFAMILGGGLAAIIALLIYGIMATCGKADDEEERRYGSKARRS
ncbi:MAG: hypothetical protein WC565_07610 [Parcubacteria group bacterium]